MKKLLGIFVLGLSLSACFLRPEPEFESPPAAFELTEFGLIRRQDWGAKAPVLAMKKHRLEKITVHHSGVAAKKGRDSRELVRKLQDYSQHSAPLGDGKTKPAWADLPYHFLIYANGDIVEGRDWQYAGDTNTDYDPTGHLLICVDGNFEVETPSPEQIQALRRLVNYLSLRHQLTAIGGHRELAETLCPGQNLLPWISQLRAELQKNTRPGD